jgi:hypothetical protein
MIGPIEKQPFLDGHKASDGDDPMKSFRKELWFHVPAQRAFINITPQVEECLGECGIKEGVTFVKDKQI